MKTTRILYSKDLNKLKHVELNEIAQRLGTIRSEIWNEYGSLKALNSTHRQIRDKWLTVDKIFNVQARLWKETLRDAIDDIRMTVEATKVIVRQKIYKKTKDESERKKLYKLLKYNEWEHDPYLNRLMRRYRTRGHNHTYNQVVLDANCYTTFKLNGHAWINVMGLHRGKRIAIPLNTDRMPTGTLRLIIKKDIIEVHYAVDIEETPTFVNKTIGVDKGYTEVYTDSDGQRHGNGFGDALRKESDYLKIKYQRRNKLKDIANKKPHKTQKIKINNLGRKKLDRRKNLHKTRVRNIIYKSTHSLFNKANIVVCEDLTKLIKGKKLDKNNNRRLSGWVKGIISESLNTVSHRRCSSVVHVNCAYTSQIDSRFGVLIGQRKGDLFYCFDGVVLDSDVNAARNVLARIHDHEIGRWTSPSKVRTVLLKRTERHRMILDIPDTSCKLLN